MDKIKIKNLIMILILVFIIIFILLKNLDLKFYENYNSAILEPDSTKILNIK